MSNSRKIYTTNSVRESRKTGTKSGITCLKCGATNVVPAPASYGYQFKKHPTPYKDAKSKKYAWCWGEKD